jgi:murein L,D-transpeptidase YafK
MRWVNLFIVFSLIVLVSAQTVNEARASSLDNFLLVKKSQRKLFVVKNKKVIKQYDVQLGGSPTGHKRFRGDLKTPEGTYEIDFRNTSSQYHLSLHINYPNDKDKAYAKSKGRSPGGDIFIHGIPNKYNDSQYWRFKGRDWTRGCIAVSNREIREIASLVPDKTTIYIIP